MRRTLALSFAAFLAAICLTSTQAQTNIEKEKKPASASSTLASSKPPDSPKLEVWKAVSVSGLRPYASCFGFDCDFRNPNVRIEISDGTTSVAGILQFFSGNTALISYKAPKEFQATTASFYNANQETPFFEKILRKDSSTEMALTPAGKVNAPAANSTLTEPRTEELCDDRGTWRMAAVKGDFRRLKAVLQEGEKKETKETGVKGVVANAENKFCPVEVNSIGFHTALIAYRIRDTFTPKYVYLQSVGAKKDEFVSIPFELVPPMRHETLEFSDPLLRFLCKPEAPVLVTRDTKSRTCEFDPTAEVHVTPAPENDLAEATLMNIDGEVAHVQITAPADYEPRQVTIETYRNNKFVRVVARKVPGATPNPKLTNISFTVLDKETTKRNYGSTIANNYLAVDLQLRNPTHKKVQINKAAVWFDVDYAPALQPEKKKFLFFGASKPAPNPFSINQTGPLAKENGEADTREVVIPEDGLFLVGRDHNHRQAPHTFEQILGAFDAKTFWERFFSGTLTISPSVLLSISKIVNNSSYDDIVSVVNGAFIPGFSSAVFDNERTKRQRANLVTQSLQNIIQVPGGAAASTTVFLPRTDILAIRGANTPVRIHQVRDVHLDLEVIAAVLDDNVAKGVVRVGMTSDDVRQALGEPNRVEEQNSNSIWSFNKGNYKQVKFNSDGLVFESLPRTLEEQITKGMQAVALKELLNLQYPTERQANDGGFIWLSVATVNKNFRFDSNYSLADPDYTDAFTVLKSNEKKLDQKAFEQKIKDLWLGTPPETISKKLKSGVFEYLMPDIKTETFTASYGPDGLVTDIKTTAFRNR